MNESQKSLAERPPGEIQAVPKSPLPPAQTGAFANNDGFELALRMAKMLSESQLVPAAFQKNIPNCVIALEMASRLGASPLSVAQNLYVVHGNPSWSAQYVIAAVNSSGKFQPLRFKMTGEGDEKACVAWTIDKTGEVLEGPAVSIAMAKAEGWYGRKGSKWQTMPELMLRYRAATFFGRLYAPELMMGMKTVEEVQDLNVIDANGVVVQDVTTTQTLNESIKAAGKAKDKPARKAKAKPDTKAEPEPTREAETQPDAAHKPDEAIKALSRCRSALSACDTMDALDEVMDLARDEIINEVHKALAKEHYDTCCRKLEGKE